MKAYPSNYTKTEVTETGMDLRDYFAAQALKSVLMDFEYREMLFEAAGDEKVSDPDVATRWCLCNYAYELADMMMEVRNGKR